MKFSIDDLPAPPAGWQTRPAGISLCMIVRDEERFLADALASVRGVVDEICIVDTGSRDATLEIARNAGARVRKIAWENDFSRARNAALEMAMRRWIFVLDADERLSPRSRELLTALRTHPAHLSGLWVRCFNFTEDYKGTGAMSNALVRIFPNHERIRYRNPIHEFVALDGNEAGMPAVLSGVEIVHLGYRADVMRERGKYERNRSIAQAALQENPDDAFNWYNYATSTMLSGSYAEAILALERMREIVLVRLKERGDGRVQSFVPNGLALLASLYLTHSSNPSRAESIARELLAFAPTFADGHFILGKSLLAQRRFAAAREAFIAAIEDGKDAHLHPLVDNEVPLWKAHSEIGASLMEEGGYDLALSWFDLALAARPAVQPVRLNRAGALEKLERFEEARAAYQAVWDDDRDDLSANAYLNFLLRRDEYREALAFIDRSAEALPPATRLILYGSAAAIADRAGLPGVTEYLERAQRVVGLDDHRPRLRALLRHLDAGSVSQLLDPATPRPLRSQGTPA
jgi:glycosyltransferase involved in cell wall biosynthesis/Flp pilus assembly protein TadD